MKGKLIEINELSLLSPDLENRNDRGLESKHATSVLCVCGESGWIDEDSETVPCPKCGRVYKCYYDNKKLKLVVEEVKK